MQRGINHAQSVNEGVPHLNSGSIHAICVVTAIIAGSIGTLLTDSQTHTQSDRHLNTISHDVQNGETPKSLTDLPPECCILHKNLTVPISHPELKECHFRIDREGITNELMITINDTTYFCADDVPFIGDRRPSEVINNMYVEKDHILIYSEEFGTAAISLADIQNLILVLQYNSTQEEKFPVNVCLEASVHPNASNTLFAGMIKTRSLILGPKIKLSLKLKALPKMQRIVIK